MSKEIYISSTPHETRLAIVENDALAEMYYERENEYTLAGSIYNGKVTRVLPGMQSSFVDIGLERDAFLYITDFMEEAGDAADFEANANAGDHGRAPRRDSQRDGQRGRGEGRGENRSRGERQPQTEGGEPSDADLFAQAVGGLDPNRGNGERTSDRNGTRRRRGRGGRDNAQLPRPESSRLDDAEPIEGDPNDLAVTSVPLEDVGEGAPGADGSRRWRGRRGRRGTHLGEQSGERQNTPSQAPEGEDRPATGPVANAYEQDSWGDPEVGAAESTTVDLNASAAEQVEEPLGRGEDGGRPRRDRFERGGREGRDRRSREQDQPTGARYGETEYAPAPSEPIILPGESLSKYRGDAPLHARSESPAQAAPVASEFILPGAWDGGAVLPGETIRPRTGSSSAHTESRDAETGRRGRDDRGRDERGRGDRGNNDRGRDRGGRPQDRRDGRGRDQQRHEGAAQAAVQHAEPISAGRGEDHKFEQTADASVSPNLSDSDQVVASHPLTPTDSTFVAPPPMPVETATAAEVPAEHREYEPTEASASYRVDPMPPSEFRQAAPVVEAEPEDASDAAQAAEFLGSHAGEEQAPPDSEITEIFATGEMHSQSIADPAAEGHDLPAQDEPAPAEPIAHENAVSSAPAPEQRVPYFEPGSGLLEEEVMEDEDDGHTDDGHTLSAVTAQHGHFDPADSETLEGAADLATMLREMSIDQITRTEPAELEQGDDDEDEEEFDEDFEEEDQNYDGSDPDDDSDDAEEPEEIAQGYGDGGDQRGEGTEGRSEGEHVAAPDAGTGGQAEQPREGRRFGRRDGRRDGRRGDRNRRPVMGERDGERGSEVSGERSSGGERNGERNRSHGRGRPSMQSTNLPAISDLLKPGQEILCQIAKEPIAKKGARITSHIALPGRFLVFMPTVSHTGVSRKIESDSERRRLKEILLSEKGDASGGFIVRTAASGASEEELRSDLRFLLNLWSDIKARSESSKSPALIYHDLNLVERVLRDQVTDTFSAIWVDSETEYERVLRFLQRFQPSLIRRVKLYTKETPLFEQFGITEEINKALRSKVWLKSGGSIVINQTEALVAIDINTGKFVGKTARLEDTIVKTNLDAIPEIVRQIRLRDLGGIIIIDFIDMDERKNRNKVMAALEEELKSDRAPSKVLQFNDFGLVAITRKRVKQSLERTLSTTCGICAGTGMVKSPVTVCNDIYVEMRKMQKHLDRGDVMLRVNPEVVKQLKSGSGRWLQEMEEMVGKTILVKSDPALHPEQFDIH